MNSSGLIHELNHDDYISYSDIKIRYRWNRGSRSLISFFHVRIRRPIESSCSWMLHRNPSLFLSSIEKGSFRITRAISIFIIHFSFRYGNAMQEVGNQVVSDDEKSFFMLCEIDDIKGSVLLEDDCRYLMVRYLWSVYLWKLSRRE